jgi:hypothetical protein
VIHAWSIGELLGAALAVAPREPTETAPEHARSRGDCRLGNSASPHTGRVAPYAEIENASSQQFPVLSASEPLRSANPAPLWLAGARLAPRLRRLSLPAAEPLID